MLLTWGLTISAFVLIFVHLKDWSAEDNPHAILGCATTALAFVQPIGAAFRPHPDSRRRPIFNWLHWLVGNVAHILGSKNVILFHVIPGGSNIVLSCLKHLNPLNLLFTKYKGRFHRSLVS